MNLISDSLQQFLSSPPSVFEACGLGAAALIYTAFYICKNSFGLFRPRKQNRG